MIPWYTWAIAALPIGGGIVWFVLGQLRQKQALEIKAGTQEGFIKSEIEVKKAEAEIEDATKTAVTNPAPDLGRW